MIENITFTQTIVYGRVEKIHRVIDVPITVVEQLYNKNGWFSYTSKDITIVARQLYNPRVLLHEYAHFLDYVVLVDNVDKHHIYELLDNTHTSRKNSVFQTTNKEDSVYFTGLKEQFARAYEQYVAYKTTDSELLSVIKNSSSYCGLTRYWTNKEFQSVMKAFDNMLYNAGLLWERPEPELSARDKIRNFLSSVTKLPHREPVGVVNSRIN